MHKAIVIGNLGADPEMRILPSGDSVTTFPLASSNRYKDAELTEWFAVSVFGKQAEAVNQYLSKGAKVFVEGQFKSRAYVSKAGEKRFGIDVVATSVEFLGGVRPAEVKDVVSKSEPAAADGSGVPAAASA